MLFDVVAEALQEGFPAGHSVTAPYGRNATTYTRSDWLLSKTWL